MADKKNGIPPLLIICAVLSGIATAISAYVLVLSFTKTENLVYAIPLFVVFAICLVASILMCKKSKTLPSRAELNFEDEDDD